MKTIVLALGGSVLVPALESHNIARYAEMLKDLGSRFRIFVVCGGGGEARRYIRAARSLGIDEGTADELGIAVTRLNARLLIGALGEAAYPVVAETYQQAREGGVSGRIVVMGGIVPAQTTDAVAAVLGEMVGADLIVNATSVDGIYSSDPKKDAGAMRHERLTPSELVDIVIKGRLDAGSNTIIDIVACKVIERCGIPLLVLDGTDPEKIASALTGGEYLGTIVAETPEKPLPLA